MLYISLAGNPREIHLRSINTSTQELGNVISTLTISNPSNSYTSTDRITTYRPSYITNLGGRIAILFINMEVAISYYNQCDDAVYSPICHMFTYGDDSLHFGKRFIHVSDPGYQLSIFHNFNNIATYGFGVMGCRTFDEACVSDFEVTLLCLVPSAQCG